MIDKITLETRLIRLLGSERVFADEPMSEHTSFRTGGPADLYVRVQSTSELKLALVFLKEAGVPVFLLGRGTNLLVGDGGYRGVVLTMTGGSVRPGTDTTRIAENAEHRGAGLLTNVSVDTEKHTLTAGAGASMAYAAALARNCGLTGLEFAAGIPGSIGGGIVMNAGAYGGEMKDVVTSVQIMNPSGSIREYAAEEMRFGYRTSILKTIQGTVVRASFALTADDPDRITERMDELAAKRRAKQPLEYPSAGSTFKRPEGHFAGKLIQDAGLAGKGVGNACVSEKHCGFVINRGGATSAEVKATIEMVQKRVLEDSGIQLEREVIYLGEF